MTQESSNPVRTTIAYLIGGIGAMCVVGGLVVYMQGLFRPAPVGSARGLERSKIWSEMKIQNQDALNNYAAVKPELGIYRLPASQAMELWARLNQEGNAAGRAKLIQRLEGSLKQVSYE